MLVNNSNSVARAMLELVGDDGRPLMVTIPGFLTNGSIVNLNLGAGATRFLQTDGSGNLRTGAAMVRSDTDLAVSAIISFFDLSRNVTTEAGIQSAEALTEFLVPVDSVGLFNTGLALFAPDQNASITLTLLDTSGRQVAETSVSCGRNSHLARFVTGQGQFFPQMTDFRGTLRVVSTVPISATALRQHSLPLSYTAMPVSPPDAGKLANHLAQVAYGVNREVCFATSFILFNPSSSTANVSLTLTRDNGAPFLVNIPGRGINNVFDLILAPGASLFLQPDGFGTLETGAAEITSDLPICASAILSVIDARGDFQSEVGVSVPPLALVKGTVRYSGNLTPLDAAVYLTPENPTGIPLSSSCGMTAPGGEYQALAVNNRSYLVNANVTLAAAGGFLAARLHYPTFNLRAVVNGTTTVDVELPNLPETVTISGKVTSASGDPLAGVLVSASSRMITRAGGVQFSAAAIADTDGVYRFKILSGTEYAVEFVPPGIKP